MRAERRGTRDEDGGGGGDGWRVEGGSNLFEMETSDAVKIQACFVSLYLFLTIPVSPPLLLLSSL